MIKILYKLTTLSFIAILVLASYLFLSSANDFHLFYLDEGKLEKIQSWSPQNNSTIYDSSNNLLSESYKKDQVYVPFEKIPINLINALIAIEDKNYWTHGGVDYLAILRVLKFALFNPSKAYKQGASTITQQVVKQHLLSSDKTILRKIQEIFLAIQVTKKTSKQKILEIYTNDQFLGMGSHGIGTAAKRFFNKNINELEDHESALIAGLFQAPTLYNPYKYPERAKKRQLKVIKAMYRAQYITREDAIEMSAKKIKYNFQFIENKRPAPHFEDYVSSLASKILGIPSIRNKGLKIYTTLDSEIQSIATEITQQYYPKEDPVSLAIDDPYLIDTPKKKNLQLALISLNPTTGGIVSMIGSSNYKKSQYNRAVRSKRQPGSLFKTILFSLALSEGSTWSDMLYISPLSLDGDYRPRSTYDEYLKETTLLRSFYKSINAPTIELAKSIGIDKVITHAKKMGIESHIKKEMGSILGSSETTVLEMAKVYSVYANQGKSVQPYAIRYILDKDDNLIYERPNIEKEVILPPKINALMVEGLRSVFQYGTASKYKDLAAYLVGKTGTTNNALDNWFAGFSTEMVTVLWRGFDHSSTEKNEENATKTALPMWMDYMVEAIQYRDTLPFSEPNNIYQKTIHPRYGHPVEEGVTAWFLEKQENIKPKIENMSFFSEKNDFRNP